MELPCADMGEAGGRSRFVGGKLMISILEKLGLEVPSGHLCEVVKKAAS